MIYSEKWGKDVDEAVQLALADLKVSADEVDVEVLEEPTKGFLGIGSQPAKVRVTVRGNEEEAAEETAKETADEELITYGVKDLRSSRTKAKEKGVEVAETAPSRRKSNGGNRRPQKSNSYNRDDLIEGKEIESIIANKPENLQPLESHPALDFISEVIENMGLDLEISAEGNGETIYIDIAGKEAGTIIGKRGQTLDAIQYLTSLVVNKTNDGYVRVVVDAENYRAKREKTLQQLAVRLGNKVIKSGRPIKLEPMNPYERMVIHATLHGNSVIKTRSEGEDPYRRVIIERQ